MIFAIIERVGEVAEWLKAHDSKSCMRLSRIGGSNPPLSARREKLTFCGLLSSSEFGDLNPAKVAGFFINRFCVCCYGGVHLVANVGAQWLKQTLVY